MKFRRALLAGLCAATLGAAIIVPAPANAAATVVYFNTAPPATRHEVQPAPRPGYVWSSGYWNTKNSKHVWQAGHWERERHGYYMTQPQWTQRDNRWELQRGHWSKGDHDGDGVPNTMDHAPDSPGRS